MRAADRAFDLGPRWRGFAAGTVTNKGAELEAGWKVFQTRATTGVLAGFAEKDWGRAPVFGLRGEVRF